MEGEVGPGAFGRVRWCWVAIGAVRDEMRWSGFHKLTSELGALFVGVVE